MKKMIIIVLLVILSIFVSACSNKYVCSNGQTVSDPSLCPKDTETEQLREEVNQLKLNERAKELVGKVAGNCNIGSDLECPGQGDWIQVESSIECWYGCDDSNRCVAKGCRARS